MCLESAVIFEIVSEKLHNNKIIINKILAPKKYNLKNQNLKFNMGKIYKIQKMTNSTNRVAPERWQAMGCLTTQRIISIDDYNKVYNRVDDPKYSDLDCEDFNQEIMIISLGNYTRRKPEEVMLLMLKGAISCAIERKTMQFKKTIDSYQCIQPEVKFKLIQFLNHYENSVGKIVENSILNKFRRVIMNFVDEVLFWISVLAITFLVIFCLKVYINLKQHFYDSNQGNNNNDDANLELDLRQRRQINS